MRAAPENSDCRYVRDRMAEKPKLQIALDNISYEDAFRTLGNGLGDTVDIVEVGTMLLLAEGLRAVNVVRAMYPGKLVVTDFKCVAPHFGSEILKRDTNYLTVLSQAEDNVIESITQEAAKRARGQEVQIELYGSWKFDDAEKWLNMGVSHIVYSRPRSRKGPWGDPDRQDISQLIDMGFKVTATGGVSYESLDVLAGLPVFAIICGRSVRNAPSPASEALRVKRRIIELWS